MIRIYLVYSVLAIILASILMIILYLTIQGSVLVYGFLLHLRKYKLYHFHCYLRSVFLILTARTAEKFLSALFTYCTEYFGLY